MSVSPNARASPPLRDRLAARALRLVTRRTPEPVGLHRDSAFARSYRETDRFFARLPADAGVDGRHVLDLGCGSGATAIWAAERGAASVVGVDIQDVSSARERLAEDFPHLTDRVEFRQIDGDDLGPGRYDLILSKNSFEHVADPDAFVAVAREHLAPTGDLVIGFAPLWKAPTGGHLDFMTPLPWVHLIFPERVVLAERRRFRPDEDPARYEEVRGGLNRMTLQRFEETMERSGLECRYLSVNNAAGASGTRRAMLGAMRVLRRVPPLREYMSFGVHSVWRHPDDTVATGS